MSDKMKEYAQVAALDRRAAEMGLWIRWGSERWLLFHVGEKQKGDQVGVKDALTHGTRLDVLDAFLKGVAYERDQWEGS